MEKLLEISAVKYPPENDARSQMEALAKNIYSDGKYRHSYSVVFRLISKHFENQNTENIENIVANLDMLCSQSVNDTNTSDGLKKLWDHVNLEYSRYMSLPQTNNAKSTDDISGLKSDIEDMKKRLGSVDEISDDSIKLKERIDKISSSSLTTLSIFAGIVITFTGAISFESKILENLKDMDLSTIGFSTSLMGIVFFNALVLLLHFIAITADTEKKKHAWQFVIAVNLILIAVFLLSVVFH